MSLPVHWVPSLLGVDAGALVELTGEEAHHAVAVRRLRVGEPVALTDGAGSRALGDVEATGKRLLAVRVHQVEQVAAAQPSFTVVQALPKGERGELAVELLTEVGVDRIVPWAAQRCVVQWRGERATKSQGRWVATSREAAKQARRAWFPQVDTLADTAQVGELLAGADLALILHEEATTPLARLQVPAQGSVVLVVGPEGGIGPEELAVLTGLAGSDPAGGRVHTVRLGAEVLRTSTAGAVAAGALMARTDRWG